MVEGPKMRGKWRSRQNHFQSPLTGHMCQSCQSTGLESCEDRDGGRRNMRIDCYNPQSNRAKVGVRCGQFNPTLVSGADRPTSRPYYQYDEQWPFATPTCKLFLINVLKKYGPVHIGSRAGAPNRTSMGPSHASIAIDLANTYQIRTIKVMKRTWILRGAEICQSSDGVNAIRDEKPCLNNTFVYSASETTSLTSSITAYRHENGRRYHAYKDGEYWGPNDEKQNEQLDIVSV